jgi:Zn-dependent protease with chaperone function
MKTGDRALLLLLAGIVAVGLLAGTGPSTALRAGDVSAEDPSAIRLDSYAEWKQGDVLVVDGQRVTVDRDTKWKGKFTSIAGVPIGYEVRLTGVRQSNGTVLARDIDVRPNGNALFEAEVQAGTNELEGLWLRHRNAFEADGTGRTVSMGEIVEAGPRVDRVRYLVNKLAPPYIDRNKLRVYVIENDEWNAMAMGNGALWVFSGIMDDMSDGELAIVMGHELAHYTHEHSRRQMRKGMWVQMGSVAALAAAEAIDSQGLKALAQIGSVLGFGAWMNGFGRDLEDQADRVGLRYAHEAGFNVASAPGVWQRFLEKYGDRNKVTNFFFSDHSTAAARRKNLEQELRFNYQR